MVRCASSFGATAATQRASTTRARSSSPRAALPVRAPLDDAVRGGDLLDACPVSAHHEELLIRVVRHPRECEQATVRRDCGVAAGCPETAEAGAVGPHGKDAAPACRLGAPTEHDQPVRSPAGRGLGEWITREQPTLARAVRTHADE